MEKLIAFFESRENCFVNYKTTKTKEGFALTFEKLDNGLINLPTNISVDFAKNNETIYIFSNYEQKNILPKTSEYLNRNYVEIVDNKLLKHTTEKDFIWDTINFLKVLLTLNQISQTLPCVIEDENIFEFKEDLVKTWILNKKLKQKTEGEVVDLYDNDRQLLAQKGIRGNTLEKRTNRLTVHIVFFNSKNQMLIQKRTTTKKVFPGLWDVSVGGGVLEGETSEQAMKREVEEELGVKFDHEYFRPQLTINFRNGFDDYYLIKDFDVELSTLSYQKEEVEKLMWADKETVLKFIENNEFIPYEKEFISVLFELKNLRGALIEY